MAVGAAVGGAGVGGSGIGGGGVGGGHGVGVGDAVGTSGVGEGVGWLGGEDGLTSRAWICTTVAMASALLVGLLSS